MSREGGATTDRQRAKRLRAVEAAARSNSARRSLTFYLAALIALQMTLLFAFVGFVSANDFRLARSAATERASEDAQKAASVIRAAVDAAGRVLVSESELPGYAAVFDDPSRCTVTSSGAGVFTRGQFHVLRGDATVACTSTQPAGGVEGPGYAGQPWLDEVREADTPVIAGPLVDPLTNAWSLIVAARIAEIPGTVVLALELGGLATGLAAELGDRLPRSVFLVTTEDRGTVIAGTARSETGAATQGTPFGVALRPGTEAVGADGAERIHAEARVPGLGWNVVAGIGTSEAFAQAWEGLKERLLFAGVILLVVVGVGWTINRRVARPIRALVGAVELAAEGDKGLRVPEEGPKEVRRLGKRFNRMLRERAESRIGLVELFESERRDGDSREVDRMKSAFLMAVSHELRTPLAVVTGYADLLQEQSDTLSSEELGSIAHDIGLGAARLERLLMDILDLERMSRGVFEAQRRPTHLRGLVKRVLEFSDTRGEVKVDVPNRLVVDVDPGLVERILENLVRNATKHTPAGTPLWIGATSNGTELELTVSDAGPGIPDALKPEVFEPFTQGETPSHSPGTGVGLSLVAQFARLHSGRAWVDDRPGGGARFHVSFADAVPGEQAPTRRSRVGA